MTSAFAVGTERFDLAHPGRSRRFVQPGRPGFWMYAVLVAVAVGLLVWAQVAAAPRPMVWLAFGVWLLWTWLGYWLICRADLLELVPTGIRLAALIWGSACLTFSGALDGVIERTLPITSSWSDAIYAPLPEDGFKLVGVVLIASIVPHVLRRPMGAVVVGLLVGLGFSAIENWYMSNSLIVQGDLTDLPGHMLMRATIGAQAHSVFAGLAAVGVWYVLAHPRRPLGLRLAVAFAWFLAGMLLHAANDAPINVAGAAVVQVVQIAALIALIWWARRAERDWVIRLTANGVPQVTGEDGHTLASRRARRTARQQARLRGREAVTAVIRRQHTQLAYLNALDADPDDTAVDHMRRQLAGPP